jgi:hypothetical protein
MTSFETIQQQRDCKKQPHPFENMYPSKFSTAVPFVSHQRRRHLMIYRHYILLEDAKATLPLIRRPPPFVIVEALLYWIRRCSADGPMPNLGGGKPSSSYIVKLITQAVRQVVIVKHLVHGDTS